MCTINHDDDDCTCMLIRTVEGALLRYGTIGGPFNKHGAPSGLFIIFLLMKVAGFRFIRYNSTSVIVIDIIFAKV